MLNFYNNSVIINAFTIKKNVISGKLVTKNNVPKNRKVVITMDKKSLNPFVKKMPNMIHKTNKKNVKTSVLFSGRKFFFLEKDIMLDSGGNISSRLYWIYNLLYIIQCIHRLFFVGFFFSYL